MNCSAVILAGGQSSRMGRDKAWLEFEGEPLLARQLRTVRSLRPAEVFISGRAGEDYSAFDCPVLYDLRPGFGPVGGLERALHAAASPLLLVVAVDLARMTAAFLEKLWARCDPLTGVVPELNGELEPLAAIYPKRCHAFARECLRSPSPAARGFAEACLAARAVRPFRVARADAGCFANWNRPADVGRARVST